LLELAKRPEKDADPGLAVTVTMGPASCCNPMNEVAWAADAASVSAAIPARSNVRRLRVILLSRYADCITRKY